MIDDIDNKILNLLQENARTPNAEIARQVDMAPSAILERIRKLEERGVIEGYAPRINARAIGLSLIAFVFVRTDESLRDLSGAEQMAKLPEVLEVHDIAGEDCYLLKVRVSDSEDLHRFLRQRLARVKAVRSTRTVIVLKTIKETTALPLDRRMGAAD